MKSSYGFTVVEMLVAIVLLGVAATAGYTLFEDVRMTHRDQDRKVAINTLHANLQEVIKPKLGAYPRTLSPSQLPAADKKHLTDPRGVAIGKPTSDYRYEASGCNGSDLCSGYRLTSSLERELDFSKTGL